MSSSHSVSNLHTPQQSSKTRLYSERKAQFSIQVSMCLYLVPSLKHQKLKVCICINLMEKIMQYIGKYKDMKFII